MRPCWIFLKLTFQKHHHWQVLAQVIWLFGKKSLPERIQTGSKRGIKTSYFSFTITHFPCFARESCNVIYERPIFLEKQTKTCRLETILPLLQRWTELIRPNSAENEHSQSQRMRTMIWSAITRLFPRFIDKQFDSHHGAMGMVTFLPRTQWVNLKLLLIRIQGQVSFKVWKIERWMCVVKLLMLNVTWLFGKFLTGLEDGVPGHPAINQLNMVSIEQYVY